jgi:molybdopterin-binding protein
VRVRLRLPDGREDRGDRCGAQINFELNRGGIIAGTVTDALTTTRLSGITVELYDAAGRMLTSTISNASVPSYSFPGLADGTYYLRTTNSLGYVDEVFDGVKCIATCNVTSGTARVVAGPVTLATDFALDRSSGRHRAVRK